MVDMFSRVGSDRGTQWDDVVISGLEEPTRFHLTIIIPTKNNIRFELCPQLVDVGGLSRARQHQGKEVRSLSGHMRDPYS